MILTGAITIIQTRRNISFRVLHPHHSVLKQIKLFGSDSQALEASTCRCTPFCSIPFCAPAVTSTPETQPRAQAVLLRGLLWSALYDGPKVSCCSYIMEYGSTPYIGMTPKKMAAPLHVYKVMCSKLCARFSHKLLWTIPVILECFHQ